MLNRVLSFHWKPFFLQVWGNVPLFSTFELPIEKSHSHLFLITWMWLILSLSQKVLGCLFFFFLFQIFWNSIMILHGLDFCYFLFLKKFFSPMIFSVRMFCNAYSSLLNLRLTWFCYLFSYWLFNFCFAFCKIFSTLSSNSSVDTFSVMIFLFASTLSCS